MKKETLICDKCGAEIVTFQSKYISTKMEVWGVDGKYSPGKRIDLCESCTNKFINFLEGGKDA